MLVVDGFAWYNKGVLQNKNRKYYFSSTKAESGRENPRGLHGSWQEENNQRGKGQEESGRGKRISNREGKMCEIIHPNFVFMKI